MTLTTADEGVFEHFINFESQTNSSEEDRLARQIIIAVSDVAHKMKGFSGARIGGSQKKHTDVSGHSDLDVIVDSTVIVTRKLQKAFCQALKTKAKQRGLKLWSYKRHYVAVAFDFGIISMDLLFSNPGKWCPQEKKQTLVQGPNPFHNNPHPQRVVRAFKMLRNQVSLILFPSLSLSPSLFVSRCLSPSSLTEPRLESGQISRDKRLHYRDLCLGIY
jgi:hypothetical protein